MCVHRWRKPCCTGTANDWAIDTCVLASTILCAFYTARLHLYLHFSQHLAIINTQSKPRSAHDGSKVSTRNRAGCQKSHDGAAGSIVHGRRTRVARIHARTARAVEPAATFPKFALIICGLRYCR